MEARRLTVHRAKQLRGRMSLPEVLLWKAIREDRLGVRFRRQHPCGPYVLDFYCDQFRLAVEVDGSGHGLGDNPGHDERRDRWLAGQGVKVLRIPARTVLKDIEVALQTIRSAMQTSP
jgi:very-short-patch-repair endonuclease